MNVNNVNIESENRFSELISFIREQTRTYDSVITGETLIEDDLGVTGEDAAELIHNFSVKFGVDITKFVFKKYFNEEPSAFLSPHDIVPFKVGFLEKAILKGRLDEEVINSQGI
jgi:acyl carrier protein